jgi:hypothetical protein
METGGLGLPGQLVVSLVEMEPRLEHETVTLLLPLMVALPVLVQEQKIKIAPLYHAVSIYGDIRICIVTFNILCFFVFRIISAGIVGWSC